MIARFQNTEAPEITELRKSSNNPSVSPYFKIILNSRARKREQVAAKKLFNSSVLFLLCRILAPQLWRRPSHIL